MQPNPIVKLFALNRKRGEFRAEQVGEEHTIYLYDVIVDTEDEAYYWGGVDPKSFSTTLAAITAPVIHLRINCPGGSVFAARAMAQAMREHPSQIIAHVDGYAASAASFLMLAASEVLIAEGAFIMIHKAWTSAYGNADDLTKTAALLSQIDASLVKTYAEATGQSAEDIEGWMTDETWFDAETAVEKGFASRLADGAQAKLKSWDMTAYKKAPALNLAPQAPARPSPAPEETTSKPDLSALLRRVDVMEMSIV